MVFSNNEMAIFTIIKDKIDIDANVHCVHRMCSILYGDGISTVVKSHSVFVLMNIVLINKIHIYPMIRARSLNYRSKNLHAI